MAPSIPLDLPADGETATWGAKLRTALLALAEKALPRDEANFEKTLLPRGVDSFGNKLDDAVTWQAAHDAGADVIRLVEGQRYFFDSYLFSDSVDRRRYLKIAGNNARVDVGANAGLRASVGPTDSTLKYLIFVNTLRSALNTATGIVATTEANTATGSRTQKVGRGLVLEDIDFRGPLAGLNVKVYHSNNASIVATGKTGYISGGGITVGYSDVSDDSTRADNPFTGGATSPSNFVQWGNGDGIDLHSFSDARGRIADLYNVHSGTIRNAVGGSIRATSCRSLTITNAHIEGDEELRRDTPIELRDVDGAIRDSEIWVPTRAKSFPAILVDNSGSSPDGSSNLLIDNVYVRHVYRDTSVADEQSNSDLRIVGLRATDRIQARGFFGAVNVLGAAHTARVAPTITSPDPALGIAIAAGQGLIATGYWDLVRVDNAWRITSPAPLNDLLVSHAVPQPTIATVQSLSSPPSSFGSVSVSYVLALMDEFGNYGPPLYRAATAITAGQCANIIASFRRSGLRLAIWRRNGNEGAYDRYIEVGVQAARIFLYDTGDSIMKHPWQTSGFPQPPAGGSDSSADRVRFNGKNVALS